MIPVDEVIHMVELGCSSKTEAFPLASVSCYVLKIENSCERKLTKPEAGMTKRG